MGWVWGLSFSPGFFFPHEHTACPITVLHQHCIACFSWWGGLGRSRSRHLFTLMLVTSPCSQSMLIFSILTDLHACYVPLHDLAWHAW